MDLTALLGNCCTLLSVVHKKVCGVFRMWYKCRILKGLSWKHLCPAAPCRASQGSLKPCRHFPAKASLLPRLPGVPVGVLTGHPLYPIGKKLLVTQDLGTWFFGFISSHVPRPLTLLAPVTVPWNVGECCCLSDSYSSICLSDLNLSAGSASSQVQVRALILVPATPHTPHSLQLCH